MTKVNVNGFVCTVIVNGDKAIITDNNGVTLSVSSEWYNEQVRIGRYAILAPVAW